MKIQGEEKEIMKIKFIKWKKVNSNTDKESISLCNNRRRGNQIIKYEVEEANIKNIIIITKKNEK